MRRLSQQEAVTLGCVAASWLIYDGDGRGLAAMQESARAWTGCTLLTREDLEALAERLKRARRSPVSR